MKDKIFFSEWTDEELLDKERCFCECHNYPGVYPTNENNACHYCHHVNEQGYLPWSVKNGWVEYWRSDKARTYIIAR